MTTQVTNEHKEMADDQAQAASAQKPSGLPLVGSKSIPPPPSLEDTTTRGGEDRYKLHRRFDRLGRLLGDEAVEHLMQQRVVVFGLGGVGGYAAEALARSAIGHLMLVDFDDVCITNSNRQIQALRGTVGKSKADLLRDRLRLVNPQAKIESQKLFYNATRSDQLLKAPWGDGEYDFVVDCIDNVTSKLHLIATCKERNIPIVSSMGAAGKLDPLAIEIADVADTYRDPLAKDIRKNLRKKYGFPAEGPMGVTAVFSTEERQWPKELSYDGGKGFKCVCSHVSDEQQCDNKSLIDGTVSFVTGAFGFACSSVVIREMTDAMMKRAPLGKANEKKTPSPAARAKAEAPQT